LSAEWTKVVGRRPVDQLFGPCGAIKYRINDGALEVVCRNGLTEEEDMIQLEESELPGLKSWLEGAMIQHALPNVPAWQREMIMSGLKDT